MSVGALPFHRVAGSDGPTVLCLHSNASSSAQWRALMERLAPRFRMLAPDSHGAGRGPAWPADHALTLDDEATLVEPLVDAAAGAVHLVGHSYGAAVALKLALRRPERIASLALYEPTLFTLLRQAGDPAAAEGILSAVRDAVALLERGDSDAAARRFIDYWSGDGAWDALPAARHSPIAESVRQIGGWKSALWEDSLSAGALAGLAMPALLMVGGATTDSARGVAAIVAAALPRVQRRVFDGLAHMAPITQPEPVNAAIEAFLLGLR